LAPTNRPDVVKRRSQNFGTSAAVWLRLQVRYDLEVAEQEMSERIRREVKVYDWPMGKPEVM
jgi:plasmid maintenance system antidote protein VapI